MSAETRWRASRSSSARRRRGRALRASLQPARSLARPDSSTDSRGRSQPPSTHPTRTAAPPELDLAPPARTAADRHFAKPPPPTQRSSSVLAPSAASEKFVAPLHGRATPPGVSRHPGPPPLARTHLPLLGTPPHPSLEYPPCPASSSSRSHRSRPPRRCVHLAARSPELSYPLTPSSIRSQFLDVILSKTQRKTPTVIRSGFKISRIRGFCASTSRCPPRSSSGADADLVSSALQTCARSSSRRRRSRSASTRSSPSSPSWTCVARSPLPSVRGA